jgi:hypothetical protein
MQPTCDPINFMLAKQKPQLQSFCVVRGSPSMNLNLGLYAKQVATRERILLLCTYQIAQAFFFHHWDRAVEIYKCFVSKHKALWKTHEAVVTYPHLSMWIGSAHMVLARFDPRYVSKARRFLRELGRAAANGNPDALILRPVLNGKKLVACYI